MNLYFTHFAFLLVVMTTNKAAAFSVGGTFLSAAEKAALEKTAEAVATAGKGITGKSHLQLNYKMIVSSYEIDFVVHLL